MKTSYIIVGAVVLITAIAWISTQKNKDADEEFIPASTPAGTTPAAALSIPGAKAGQNVQLNPKHGMPGHRCDIPEGAPLNAPATTTPGNIPQIPLATPNNNVVSPHTNSNPATGPINPPHGEPGHRCDIAVGAPLPATSASISSSPSNITANRVPTPAATTASPPQAGGRKNPPHGEPGHRCDIAVGAPLDSKPAPVPAPTPTPTPAPVPTPAAPITMASGRNPAHGQPGHTCDLPVGASFDSARLAKGKS